MLASSWKKPARSLKTGKKKTKATAMLNRCRSAGCEDGMRTKMLPRGYAISKHVISCGGSVLDGLGL